MSKNPVAEQKANILSGSGFQNSEKIPIITQLPLFKSEKPLSCDQSISGIL